MKILNLYAGLGGNRKLWDGHEITAVEIDEQIADMYKSFYPQDTLVIADAHQFLLENYQNYDFIWSSPPCPTHSRSRFWGMNRGYKPVYPDMHLYEEILLLKHYYKGKWVVENVIPFYQPLIEAKKLGRHLYWSNFELPENVNEKPMSHIQNSQKLLSQNLDVDISQFPYNGDKRVLLRNCVDPETGNAILNWARADNVNQGKL